MNLPAPTNLNAVLDSSNVVNLTWADNSKKETGFEIQQKVDAGTFTTFAKAPANATSLNGFVVAVGHTYAYRIRALQGGHLSPWSNVAIVQALEPAITYGWVTTPIVNVGFVFPTKIASSGALNCAILRNVNWSDKLTVFWFTDAGAWTTMDVPFPGDTGRIGTAHCALAGNVLYLLTQGASPELFKVTEYSVGTLNANGIPMSLSFFAEFSFGDADSRNGQMLIRSDGSPVAIVDNQGGAGIVYVASKPVGGIWKANSAAMGAWLGGDRAHLSSAIVNPSTGFVEFYQSGDGEHKIMCSIITSVDPLVFTVTYLGPSDGFLAPGGENVFSETASQPNGATILAYCNDNWTQVGNVAFAPMIGIDVAAKQLLGQTEPMIHSLPVGLCANPSLALFYFSGTALRENFNGADVQIADDCGSYGFNPQRRQLAIQTSTNAVNLVQWKASKPSPSVLDT